VLLLARVTAVAHPPSLSVSPVGREVPAFPPLRCVRLGIGLTLMIAQSVVKDAPAHRSPMSRP